MTRKVIDCRESPGSNCSLTLVGEEEEVIRAASDHAVGVHGYERSADLDDKLRQMMKDEVPIGQVGQMPSEDIQAQKH